MVQIIPAAQPKMTTGQKLAGGLEKGLALLAPLEQEARAQQLQKQERQNVGRYLEQLGLPEGAGNLPEKVQQELAKQYGKYAAQNKLLEQLGLREEFGPNQPSEQTQFEPPRTDQVNEQGEIEVGNVKIPTRKLIPQSKIIQAAAINPAIADKLQKYNDTILAQQRHEEDIEFRTQAAQTKDVRESYRENQPYIDKTYDQYEDSLRKDAILDVMKQKEESGELSDSGIINLLERIGLKPEWLKNPANEEYTKLGLDLLGGGTLQADYGSRVLASEFKVAQQRIPTLSQTPEGRAQIRENIKAMLLPAKLKRERMQYYLDKSEREGKPLPHNLRGKILQDIKPQLEEAYDKFKQRNGRYQVKKGTYPDDNAIEKYYYLSDGDEDKAMKMMAEDGYDIKPKRNGGISTKSTNSRTRQRISTEF